MPKTDEGNSCLTANCMKPATRRGLCTSCRMQARRAVQAGTITESELIEWGLLLPKQKKLRGLMSIQIQKTKESRNEKKGARRRNGSSRKTSDQNGVG